MRRFIVLCVLSVSLFVAAFVLAAQGASQPASTPVDVGLWGWLKIWLIANWYYLLTVVLLPSLIVGLRQKSMREGFIGFLEAVLERWSLTQPKNSAGTFKLFGVKANPPVKPPTG
jgi:hypothetical protein